MELLNSPDFASHIENLMLQYHVPGLAVAIVQNEQVASAGYGVASALNKTPVTPDTLFDIASSAKVLTAASIAALIDNEDRFKHIQWDTPVSHILPDDFVMVSAEYTQGVTIEDILSHRTGLPAHDSSYRSIHSSTPDTPQSVTRNLRNLDIAAPLRTKFLYNNMLYTVATHIIESTTQQPFSTFLDETFFQPLNMTSTHLQPSTALSSAASSNVATGYIFRSASNSYEPVTPRDSPESQGAGLLYSTAHDYIQFVRALVQRTSPMTEKMYRGLVRARTIVNPSAWRLKPHCSPAMYAAGIESYWYRGTQVLEHDGMDPGWGSRFFLVPERKLGAVVFGNAAGAAAIGTILKREIIDHVLGLSWMAPRAKKGKSARARVQVDFVDVLPPRDVSASEQIPSELMGFVGGYCNAGYHVLGLTVRNGVLFVDALDRSMGFTVTFERFDESQLRVCRESVAAGLDAVQLDVAAHLEDVYGEFSEDFQARFIWEGGRVRWMGLRLELALKGLIWFERVDEGGAGTEGARGL